MSLHFEGSTQNEKEEEPSILNQKRRREMKKRGVRLGKVWISKGLEPNETFFIVKTWRLGQTVQIDFFLN